MTETAIILAAGLGTRLMPLTANVPKPLLLANGNALISYAMNAVIYSGISHVIVVVGYKRNEIIEYLNRRYAEQILIEYAEQNNICGTGNAALQALNMICCDNKECDSNILITASDYVLSLDYINKLLSCHANNNTDLTVGLRRVSPLELKDSSLVVLSENTNISKIVEKPNIHIDANVNVWSASLLYIVPPTITNYLRNASVSSRNEYELPDVINNMISDGYSVGSCFLPSLPSFKLAMPKRVESR